MALRHFADASHRVVPIHHVKQPSFFVPGSFCLRVLFLLFHLRRCRPPSEGIGGAPIRHPSLLTSPQVASCCFRRSILFGSALLTPPLAFSGYITYNRDRSQGISSCAPGTSFPPPSYEAFVARVATPMVATCFCSFATGAKAGSSNISGMAASATWAWAALVRFRSHWRES